MTEGTEPLPRLRPKWDACGECRRCCAGTGQAPADPGRDCYAEFLNRPSRALGIREPEATR